MSIYCRYTTLINLRRSTGLTGVRGERAGGGEDGVGEGF